MTVETKYEIGDMVIVKHDPDKLQRMVTSFSVRGSGPHSYCLSCGEKETWHYEYEINKPNIEEKKPDSKDDSQTPNKATFSSN